MGRTRRPASGPSGRWSSGLLPSSVEGNYSRQLGLVGGIGGFGDSFDHGSPPVCQANLLSSSGEPREGFGSEGRGKDHASQGCGRGGTVDRLHPRLLFQNVSGQEEVRSVASNHRSQCFQQARGISSFQDGDPQEHHRFCGAGYVGNFGGSEGCLFPYPHQEIGTEVPPFHLRRQGLPVPGHAFWPHHGSTGFYQAVTSGGGVPALPKYRCSYLLRRFPHVAHDQGFIGAGHQSGPEALAEGRFHSLQREIRGIPCSGFCVPGLPFQYGFGYCPSARGQVLEGPRFSSDLHQHVSGSGSLATQLPWVSQLPGRCGSVGTSSHQTPANVPSLQLAPLVEGLGSNATLNSVSEGLCLLVDSSGQRPCRGTPSQAKSNHDPVHGCFHDRVGRLPGRSQPIRGVVRGTALGAHKCAGDEGSPVVSAIPKGSASGSGNLSGDRQLHSCRLPGETGGYQISHSVCPGHQDTSSLPGVSIDRTSQAPPWQTECLGRHPIQASPAGVDGMAAETLGVPSGLSGMGQTSHRSVCHSTEHSVANLCLSGPRPKGLGNRCSLSGLERNECLCISSVQFGGQGAPEVSRSSVFSPSGSSLVAEAALVPRVAVSSCGSASTATTQSRPSSTASVQGGAFSSSDPPPSRVEAITECLTQAGFSADVSESITRSIRASSSAIYQSRWRIFCDWCGERQIDPLKASVQVIADFLLMLFRERNLAPGTIAGYRSALASVFSFLGRQEVSSSSSLSALIRGFNLDRPRVKQLAPHWNLAFVLDSLTRAPYEPLGEASLKFLTFKTVFLMALASGRRRSEVHAFSSLPSCLRWSRGYSAVSLVTDPAFLAKNQVPGFSPEPVRIPSLSSVVGSSDSDRLLCPCRALRFYLDKTKGGRGSRSRLFLPIKQGQHGISAQSISRWICEVIRYAYDHSEEGVRGQFKVRAHEIRALATSWALLTGSSFQEVMSAAFWRGQTTFTDHYLRSLASVSDDLFSLGPLVVAQSLAVPPPSGQ